MSGISGLPAMTYYSASKFAVEGFSEALSKELKPEWNIKIGIIAFGNFKTNVVQALIDLNLPSLPAYEGGVVTDMRSAFHPEGGNSPVAAAREMYRIANDPASPSRVRLLLGADTIGFAKGQIKQLQADTDVSEPLAATLV
ncbi:hypothetical protein M422DRAFT_275817 [Sphaerobolus stellatus SS14]|uniref:Uncharacterized protein n=1 Tax=Sphaerobolus stellatus (strain SS14) TaxID=990650 RepID=A0A0C9UEE7_SPHS4|nr:hypothetical protein M422DRAFT_275817 [Sphaerobolus stellatus SS14]